MLKSNGEATSGREQGRWRYLPAALFDLALVVAPTAVAVSALRERFVVLPTDDGSPRFSEPDQERINDIELVFNRSLRFGDELHTLSGSGWWLAVTTLVAATVIVFVAVPTLRNRQTPGQHVMGIETVNDPIGEAVDPLDHIDLSDGSAESEPAADDDNNNNGEQDEQLPDPFTVTPESEQAIERHSVFAGKHSADESLDITESGGSSITLVQGQRLPSAGPTLGAAPGRSVTGQITLADDSDYLRWDRQRAAPKRSGTTLIRSTARPTPTGQPEWSSDWQSWMYWDGASKRWFRDDTNDDRWVPIS